MKPNNIFALIFWIVILINYTAINIALYLGVKAGNVALLFEECQPITFLSSLQLISISYLALFTYIIGRVLHSQDAYKTKQIKIWLFSAILFAFCTIDEYFMLHEGIDGDIATIFFGIKRNPHLDGLTLGIYLLIAGLLFLKFKEEILKYKDAVILFCVAGVFFIFSIALDLKSVDRFKIVLEETSKLVSVMLILLGHINIFIENVATFDRHFKKW